MDWVYTCPALFFEGIERAKIYPRAVPATYEAFIYKDDENTHIIKCKTFQFDDFRESTFKRAQRWAEQILIDNIPADELPLYINEFEEEHLSKKIAERLSNEC